VEDSSSQPRRLTENHESIQNAINGKMPHAMQCNANQEEKKEDA
jgi:hypothetical protein